MCLFERRNKRHYRHPYALETSQVLRRVQSNRKACIFTLKNSLVEPALTSHKDHRNLQEAMKLFFNVGAPKLTACKKTN